MKNNNMVFNPIEIFKEYYQQEQKLSSVRIPSACCFTTNGTDGFPNTRFVSLKEVTDEGFVITGTLSSRKGIETSLSNKVALTFWWPTIEVSVRIQGIATKISNTLADDYFSKRSLDCQVISTVSKQGNVLENLDELKRAFDSLKNLNYNKQLQRPDNWGGYLINPIRIEFLQLKETRFHDRRLYEKHNENWKATKLQP